MSQPQVLTLDLLQAGQTTDTDHVIYQLLTTPLGCYAYYGELVARLHREYGKPLPYWRTKLSQLWPEGRTHSTNKKCQDWLRLRTSTGYLIFTRREDYDRLLNPATEGQNENQ